MENTTPEKPVDPVPPVVISFDERKEHYEALITLFKYAIGSLTLVITVAGSFIGFTVYSDGKEMRATMREQQQALQKNTTDFNNKQLEMHKSLIDLIKSTREDVSLTSQRAIDQINSIREESSSIARIEAKKRIEQVFEENKIEDFIVQVAKDELEPQVKKIVDDKIVNANEEKLENALKDLTSPDISRHELAYLYFQKPDPSDWSEEQLVKIVDVLQGIDDNDEYKASICIYLGLTKSSIIENYFKAELIENPRSQMGIFSLSYLIRNNGPQLPSYFLDSYKKCQRDMRPNFYHRLLEGALSSRNNALTLSILNHKELVDLLFQDLNELKKLNTNSVESMKQGINGLIQGFNFQESYKSTYFFVKE